jgi:hypothetical protein
MVALAPAAQADAQTFLSTVRMYGITGSDSVLLDWGMRVCVDLSSGYTPARISRNVYLNTAIMQTSGADQFVGAAIGGLCPQYAYRIGALV